MANSFVMKDVPDTKITIYGNGEKKFTIESKTETDFTVYFPHFLKITAVYMPNEIYEILDFIQANRNNKNVRYEIEASFLQYDAESCEERKAKWAPAPFDNCSIDFSLSFEGNPGKITYTFSYNSYDYE